MSLEIKDKKFLVIGGAGFIGSHIVEQLISSGASLVRVYDNFARGTKRNLDHLKSSDSLEIFLDGGDILHQDTLNKATEGIDGVFHLAALWLLHCYEYPRSAFEVNVTGTMNVIEAVVKNNVKKIVFSSSASVYGEAEFEPMTENHPLNSEEFYGATKISGEMLLKAIYHKHKDRPTKFQCNILRYMNVYGVRQDDKGAYVGVIPKTLAAYEKKIPPVIHGDGSQAYDFVDVRDCARANLCAMESELPFGVLNVGTGTKTSINTLIKTISNLTDSKIKPSYQDEIRPFVRNRVADIDLTKKEIGFESKINLEQGLRDYIHWKNEYLGSR